MVTALKWPDKVEKLVVVDNSPWYQDLPRDYGAYFRKMIQIDETNITKYSEADKMMSTVEKDILVRGFLLSNLKKDSNNSNTFKFRVPIELISKSLKTIEGFPASLNDLVYDSPTLVIRALKAPFIPDSALPVFKKFFPKYELVSLDCGHWVHFEKPKEFSESIINFLNN